MKKIIFGVMILFLVATISTISAEQTVTFNGQFGEGKTLYSNWYNGVSEVYGKDVYPIRGENYCETKIECKTWNYHYFKTCVRFNSRGKCISYKKTKIYDDCRTYKTVKICKNTQSYGAICYNPNGEYTNQLRLKDNFFYSYDGVNWIQVNYGFTYINPSRIKFKVVIPNVCRPNYNINSAITID